MNVWDSEKIKQHEWLVRRLELCGFSQTHIGILLAHTSRAGKPLSPGAVQAWRKRTVQWVDDRIRALTDACNRRAAGESVDAIIRSVEQSPAAPPGAPAGDSPSDAPPGMPCDASSADALLGTPDSSIEDSLQATLLPHQRTIIAGILWLSRYARTETARLKALLQLGEWLYGRPIQRVSINDQSGPQIDDAELVATLQHTQKAILLQRIATVDDVSLHESEIMEVVQTISDESIRDDILEALERRKASASRAVQ